MEPVDGMISIVPKIRNYPWGDTTFIPSLLEIEADETPTAQLWICPPPKGASPLASFSTISPFFTVISDR